MKCKRFFIESENDISQTRIKKTPQKFISLHSGKVTPKTILEMNIYPLNYLQKERAMNITPFFFVFAKIFSMILFIQMINVYYHYGLGGRLGRN